jgi:dipeptidase D
MGDPLAALQPRSVWSLFSKIASIPRPSKHEDRMAAWIRSLAEEHGFSVKGDAAGNLVVRVPATPGHEDSPVVILQSHLDMVCEKNGDVTHDFLNDPIRPRLDGGWVRASGTTLGADNGIGVAAALASAVDSDVVHGPLELLFTVEEETGLNGAAGVDARMLDGRMLINLDSEEDGVLFVGCAGGADNLIDFDAHYTSPTPASRAYHVRVLGLRGGHSGIDIHENRGNAIKVLTRLLAQALDAGIPLELFRLSGGSMRNAIPREAEAVIFLEAGAVGRFEALIPPLVRELRHELRGTDEGLELRADPCQHDGQVLERADRNRLLQLLQALPHGPLALSPEIPGLVETSSCLAVVDSLEDKIRIVASSRSSVPSALRDVQASVRAIAALAGADVQMKDGYPGWVPDLDSPLLDRVRAVVGSVWGAAPRVTAVHAGLECGILGQKISDLAMLSFGPQIEGAHSPDERVQVASVERFWNGLTAVLADLARTAA